MNKALINKYWKEFCHWKDDGEVEVFTGLATGNGWTTISHNYLWTSPNAILVISDEYVEYRKALAEGKTVERIYSRGTPNERWQECPIYTEFPLEDYRIKPDEPEFKVGDYIITPNHGIRLIHKIDNKNCYYDSVNTANKYKMSELRLWTLELADDNEWVHYWNKRPEHSYSTCRKKDINTDNFEFIVPAIGQTPSQLGLEK